MNYITVKLTKDQFWQVKFDSQTALWRLEQAANKRVKPSRALEDEIAFRRRLLTTLELKGETI